MENNISQNQQIKKSSISNFILFLSISSTVLSFCAVKAISQPASILMYLFWVLYAFMLFLEKSLRINRTLFYMIGVYLFLYFGSQILFFLGAYSSPGMGPGGYLIYCIPFYFLGFNMIDEDDRLIHYVVYSYVVSNIIFTVLLYAFLYEMSDNTVKNNAGQLLGIGIILEIFVLPHITKNTIIRIIGFAFGLFSLVTLFVLHSRTPFIASLMVFFFWLFEKKRKVSVYFFVAVIVIALYCVVRFTAFGQESLQSFLIGDQRYGDQGLSNIDAVLSGRPSLYTEAINDFLNHPFFGRGGWAYVESFPLNVLRTGGLMAGLLLLPFVYGKIILNAVKRFNTDDKEDNSQLLLRIAKYISAYFLIVSLMEGFPPLGPGTSVFFLWLVLGMKDAVTEKTSLQPQINEANGK